MIVHNPNGVAALAAVGGYKEVATELRKSAFDETLVSHLISMAGWSHREPDTVPLSSLFGLKQAEYCVA